LFVCGGGLVKGIVFNLLEEGAEEVVRAELSGQAEIRQSSCLHDGDARCLLQIAFTAYAA
jgi:hypothetical protein